MTTAATWLGYQRVLRIEVIRAAAETAPIGAAKSAAGFALRGSTEVGASRSRTPVEWVKRINSRAAADDCRGRMNSARPIVATPIVSMPSIVTARLVVPFRKSYPERIGGAVQPGSDWRQWRQIVGLLDARVHLFLKEEARTVVHFFRQYVELPAVGGDWPFCEFASSV